MDIVPKRQWTTSALVLIIAASLIMIISGSLDGAAAWANIIALPVAIVGVVVALRTTGNSSAEPDTQDRGQGNGGAPIVNQNAHTNTGDVIQVAHDYIRHSQSHSDGR